MSLDHGNCLTVFANLVDASAKCHAFSVGWLQKMLESWKPSTFDAWMWYCTAKVLPPYHRIQYLSNVWLLPDDFSHHSTPALGEQKVSQVRLDILTKTSQSHSSAVSLDVMRVWVKHIELNTHRIWASRNCHHLIALTYCRHMDTVVGMVHPCWVNSQGNSQAYRGIIPPGCVWGTPLNPPPGWQMNNTNDSGPLLGSAASHHASLLRHNSAPVSIFGISLTCCGLLCQASICNVCKDV